MKSEERSQPEKIVLNKKDKFWVFLAVLLFLILFALILLYGDGLLGSLM